MINQNYPYGIFNIAFLDSDRAKQKEAQRQWEQNKNIADMVKAISDYCEAARKVAPDYQQLATLACLDELKRQMEKENGGRF